MVECATVARVTCVRFTPSALSILSIAKYAEGVELKATFFDSEQNAPSKTKTSFPTKNELILRGAFCEQPSALSISRRITW